jgi:hypothetical protein
LAREGENAVKPEEIEGLFRDLKAKVDAGTISEDEFEAQLRELLFQDESGTYWTVGAQTQNWYRHENGDWVRASPPPSLDRALGKVQESGTEAPAVTAGRQHGLNRSVVLGTLGLLLGACLVVAGALYYWVGRTPSSAVPAAASPAAPTHVTSTRAPEPTAAIPSTAATAVPTEQESPTPQVTATREVAGSTPPPPTATAERAPSVTPISRQVLTHSAPNLVLPEDGTERGPGYQAVLIWEPVDNLRDDEYYHVEVCWNECTVYWGDYVRETSWIFPEFLRGESVDDRYYWHVTVRRQIGEAPAGPSDPATSPPSETWAFLFPPG